MIQSFSTRSAPPYRRSGIPRHPGVKPNGAHRAVFTLGSLTARPVPLAPRPRLASTAAPHGAFARAKPDVGRGPAPLRGRRLGPDLPGEKSLGGGPLLVASLP